MTLLDASGNPTGQEAEDQQWMTEALIHWLGNERTQVVLLRQRLFTFADLKQIQRALILSATTVKAIKRDQLRQIIIRILSNRVARIRLAAEILRREYENREGYEIVIRQYDDVLALWAQEQLSGRDVGPRPEDPRDIPVEEIPCEPRPRGVIMKALLEMRDELVAQADSKIESPFA